MRRPTRPVFAANWKMHKGPRETAGFVREFVDLHGRRPDATVVFFPPAISITAFREAAGEREDLQVGIQDVHPEARGAHTGAVSAGMALEAGATWGLAGHSERRREFGDDDGVVARKLARLVEEGLQACLCVGETLEEREAGGLEAVLTRQVETAVRGLSPADRSGLVYAYEPVWAIGTGRTASPQDAAEAHAIVRARIEAATDADTAAGTPILYGGSVKPGNIADLLAAEGVDGVLVGGASLEPHSFARICAAEA